MTIDTANQTFTLLENIRGACKEIQKALNEHLEKTSNQQYKEDIERDLVLLENVKHVTHAVKADIENNKVGASTELLLRVAANDFKNKLNMIPEKKALIKELLHHLKDVHGHVMHYTHSA